MWLSKYDIKLPVASEFSFSDLISASLSQNHVHSKQQLDPAQSRLVLSTGENRRL